MLPIDVIFGIPYVGGSTTMEEFTDSTQENIQVAFELASRNLSERNDKHKYANSKLPLSRNSPLDKSCWYANHIKEQMDRIQSLSSDGEGRTHVTMLSAVYLLRWHYPSVNSRKCHTCQRGWQRLSSLSKL